MPLIFGIIAGAVSIAALSFLMILLSTLFGGITGWVVGLVFPFVIDTLNQLAGTQLTAFEMGAVLGFFGSFFRIHHSTKTTKTRRD